MRCRRTILLFAITLWASVGLLHTVVASQPQLKSLKSQEIEWELDDTVCELPVDDQNLIEDFAVVPSQMTAPRLSLNTRPRGGQNSPASVGRSTAAISAAVGVASVPYMIGDEGAGSCMGFQGLLQAQLSHPTLACARLNIAEANSPLPTNRFYYSYRHFENASTISAYQFRESINLDRYLMAWEHLCWDGMASLELRLPLEDRIRSDIFSLITPTFGVVDPLVGPNGGRRVELGNIAGIFKYLLLQRDSFAISAGLGVTLPTAQDVQYNVAVDGQITYNNSPGLTADEIAAFQSVFANETIYLEPFLGWLAKDPTSPWFHQGFLQVEVAANPSHVTVFGDGATLFSQSGVPIGFYDFNTPIPVQVDLFAQTLMRLNLGLGYLFVDNPRASGLRQLTGLFEAHYTSTLEDANLSNVPLNVNTSVGTVPLQQITIGNGKNRVDILNLAMGVSMNYAGWIMTNGVVAPLRNEANRGFDFEYNMQIQRPF